MQHIKEILDKVLLQAAEKRLSYLEYIKELLGSDMLSTSERHEYETIKNYLSKKYE